MLRFPVHSHVSSPSFPAIRSLASPTKLQNQRRAVRSQHALHTSNSMPARSAGSVASDQRMLASGSPLAKPPLAHLPFSSVLRGFLLTTMTSSPILLPPAIRLLSALAYSESHILSPRRNAVTRWILKNTIYKHFCAGENAAEIMRTVDLQRKSGIPGVLLGYAREVEMRGEGYGSTRPGVASEDDIKEIREWTNGTLETVRMAPEGEFVCLK